MATQNEPTLIDEERLRNVLARAATDSRDAGLVERYLVNGAGFWVRTVEDKQTVEVILTFDSAYRELAALRSKAWGTTPSEPTDEERATALLVMRAHPWIGCYPDLRASLSCGPPLGRRCVHCEEKP
jgi:hypothetical protein